MQKSYTHPVMDGIKYFKDKYGRFYFYVNPSKDSWFTTKRKVYSGMNTGFVEKRLMFLVK